MNFNLSNIIYVKPTYQKRQFKDNRSKCYCYNYKVTCDSTPLNRGESVTVIQRRLHKNSKTTFYKIERWRTQCYILAYVTAVNDWYVLNEYIPSVKKQKQPGIKLADKFNFTSSQLEFRLQLQSKIRTYRMRLKDYQAKTNPDSVIINSTTAKLAQYETDLYDLERLNVNNNSK